MVKLIAIGITILMIACAALILTSANLNLSAQTSSTTVNYSVPSSASAKCHSINGLPDQVCTPGSINALVTQENIGMTICRSGYTNSTRPSTSYTAPLKIVSIADYGYKDTNTSDYEYDHLISLEIGGSPTDTNNLWAEPRYGSMNSLVKDKFENYLHRQVCNNTMLLAEAQRQIATNWTKYWIATGKP